MPEGLHALRNSTGYSRKSSSVTVSTVRYAVEYSGILSRSSLFKTPTLCGV